MEHSATSIAGASAHLPSRRLSTLEVEQRIAASGGGFRPHPGRIERLTGIRWRHVLPDAWQASDLAVAATRRLLADAGAGIREVDLLLFASASQDMVEPATAHIVAAKLGATCPVMDVKNACNSFLNGIQVAEALIATGQHRRVVVCTGEAPSRAVRWRVRDAAQFMESLPGYTMSDGGGAMLLERAGPGSGGRILHRAFTADSSAWDVGTLPAGGSAHPREEDATYFRMDGRRLRAAFEALGTGVLDDALAALGKSWSDFAAVCVHQVSMPYLRVLCGRTGIPLDRTVITLPDHGNLASATLPLQLSRVLRRRSHEEGDLVALVGLAGGVSMGIVAVAL